MPSERQSQRKRARGVSESPAPPPIDLEEVPLPVVPTATSQLSEIARPIVEEPVIEPQKVPRGVLVFDLDGTILDDVSLISHVAADVLFHEFGTPPEEGRIHYLATTGMPFEAQLAQLYPDVPAERRRRTARVFHDRKVAEAYAHTGPFPEVPRLLRRLAQAEWTLVVSTGAERETADLLLEREGLRYWFEAILGSGQGTKREHLREYRRRYPGVPVFLIGDSRFDMEAATSVPGVRAVGRACALHGWTLTPADLERWGAVWADYSLAELPEALERLTTRPRRTARARGRRRRTRPTKA